MPQGGSMLDARDLADWAEIEERFMDKLCTIRRMPTDAQGLRRGTATVVASNVPCSVQIASSRYNPFSTPTGAALASGKEVNRIITVALGTNLKQEDELTIGSQVYDVGQLAVDESFPSVVLIDAALAEGDATVT